MKNGLLKFAALGTAALLVSGIFAVRWIGSSGNDSDSFRRHGELTKQDRSTTSTPAPPSGDRRPAFATDSEIEYANFVEFPDGTKVALKWHRMPTPAALEEPPFSDDYPFLRKEAEGGNAALAFRLWQILSRCHNAYETEEELTNALNMIQETHRVQLPGMEEPKYVASANSRDVLQKMMAQSFRTCAGLTSEQKAEQSRWLKDAAFAGYPVAMMEYSSIAPTPDIGLAIDTARWQKGDAHALQSLADRYWQTYVSGVHPDNKVRSFAHLYAYTRVAEVRFERDGSTPDARLVPVRQRLQEMTDRMQPAEIDEGIELAKSLVSDNPACCFSF